ncbi:hypothetical protein SDJN02_06333 [Cucurbita argyrosperma subsp. argyrosperma]|nr:hypothetical protein SDJN02_06333 [Cucurbita argyrosperma subsp. argyrosperma]
MLAVELVRVFFWIVVCTLVSSVFPSPLAPKSSTLNMEERLPFWGGGLRETSGFGILRDGGFGFVFDAPPWWLPL